MPNFVIFIIFIIFIINLYIIILFPIHISKGDMIPQVSQIITKDSDQTKTCHVSLTNDDWDTSHFVYLKATMDEIFDGNHMIRQNVSIHYMVNQGVELEELVKTLLVSEAHPEV